ncbi:regulator of chromosome [Lasius niger]|uniref:Regulator of chromosome n=1 Tax=Lasius niger TaxID=67767 RepID=A0A0J7KCX7_LASNI|nr:regulator of chromosome [Lasius niger]
MSVDPVEESDVRWCPARVPENKKKRIVKDREERGCVVSPVSLKAKEIEISSRSPSTLRQRRGSTNTLLLVEVKATGDRQSKPIDLQKSVSDID